jgi:hypothetical protein
MDQSIVDKIVNFINEIGIPCQLQPFEGDAFLPGIFIKQGTIYYNPELMKYPGDLLHEAGHIAILLPGDRREASPEKMFGDVNSDAAEMTAIAWSWAALQHLQIDPAIVFHKHGYKGGAENLISNFNEGKYLGVPMLQWLGMTKGSNSDKVVPENCYPKMTHWLRQG